MSRKPRKTIPATACGGPAATADGGARGGYPPDPLEQAETEGRALREELERIRRLAELGQENAELRRRAAAINEVIEAVNEWRATKPDRPTQENIAAAMKPPLPVRRLQERLALYPGLWQALTGDWQALADD